jgi:hypothetical protein
MDPTVYKVVFLIKNHLAKGISNFSHLSPCQLYCEPSKKQNKIKLYRFDLSTIYKFKLKITYQNNLKKKLYLFDISTMYKFY